MLERPQGRPIAAVLPFGNGRAEHGTTLQSLCDTMGRSIQGSWDLFLKERSTGFYHYSYPCCIGSLKLASTTSTPVAIRRDEVPYGTLMFPTSGSTLFKVRQKGLHAASGRSAVFLSGCRREAESGPHYAAAQVVLEREQIVATATAMLGPDTNNIASILDLNNDRELRLDGRHRQFALFIENQFSTIDAMLSHPGMLERLGVDDLMLRSIVMLLAPDHLLREPATESPQRSNTVIDGLCEFIDAHLGERITLTELENISGYSARSLQIQFKKQLQCSPLEWIRARRLDAAHRQLSKECQRTVTEIALNCGFSHMSLFSAYYRERFGESPSETQQRAKAN